MMIEKIAHTTKHPKEVFILVISRLLERAHYYGVRYILVLYLLSETIAMDRSQAFEIYGVLVMSIIISGIIGAGLGDLVLTNRMASLIGGSISALGAFVLAIPSNYAMYFGLGLLVLGTGMYSPNLLAQVGKQYYNKLKLLDSGFSILYLAVNIGAFIGALFIGTVADQHLYSTGFLVSGVVMIASVILLFVLEKEDVSTSVKTKLSLDSRILYSIGGITFMAFFWLAYEVLIMNIIEIPRKLMTFYNFDLMNRQYSLTLVYTVPTLFLTLVFALFWSYYYFNQYIKLALGFFFAIGAVVLFMQVSTEMNDLNAMYVIASFVLMALAEVHVAPVVLSILTKYTTSQYLAIAISFSLFITYIYSLAVSLLTSVLLDFSSFYVVLSIFVPIFLILLVVLLVNNGDIDKENHHTNTKTID